MIVSRRSVLCIMFVVLMLADIGVGKAMISAYSSPNSITAGDDKTRKDRIQKTESDFQENEETYGESETEELDVSGVEIDITDDEVPCILGTPFDDLYDSSDDEYFSIYQNEYSKLLSCSYVGDNSVTFCLDQKFSKLSFRLGQWEMEKDNHGIVSIYKGKSAKESSLLLRVRRKPAERDKSYSVDVSDCNFITIQTKSNDFGAAAPLVTNGFKVTYK